MFIDFLAERFAGRYDWSAADNHGEMLCDGVNPIGTGFTDDVLIANLRSRPDRSGAAGR